MTQQQTYKIVLLGDKHSGKRSLLQHAFEVPERISDFYMPIEFVEVDGKNTDGPVKAVFFDSLVNAKMVPEEDSSFVDVFASEVLANARAVLLCYSCTNEESLDNIIMWNRLARKHINPSTHVYLVGTKFDGAAMVDDDTYEHIRDSVGNIHGDYRTSAITGENVKALFARVFNGFTELPLTMNKTELTLPMLRTPTKFNLSASRLNLSNSRLNLSHREVQTSPKNNNNKPSSYGIVLTSPKGTTSLRRVPTTNDQGSLTEMAPEREAKPASFNITISKIFGRGAAANNELRKTNTPGRNFDNTLDTSLGNIQASHRSQIFGSSQKRYSKEDDIFSSRNALNHTNYSMGRSYSRLNMRSPVKTHLFAKLPPKYLEEDRTELEDETLDESAIRGGKKSGKNVRVLLPSDKILNDSIVMDIKYNKEDEEKNNGIDKTPKFEVSEIKEDSRFNHQDSKYVLKIFF